MPTTSVVISMTLDVMCSTHPHTHPRLDYLSICVCSDHDNPHQKGTFVVYLDYFNYNMIFSSKHVIPTQTVKWLANVTFMQITSLQLYTFNLDPFAMVIRITTKTNLPNPLETTFRKSRAIYSGIDHVFCIYSLPTA